MFFQGLSKCSTWMQPHLLSLELNRRGFFSTPSANNFKLCTSGTPAFIMVAIWRVNSAISMGFMDCRYRVAFGLFFTAVARIPCLSNWALTLVMLLLDISPETFLPLRSTPLYKKYGVRLGGDAIGINP